MNNVKFSPYLFLRTPAFSYTDCDKLEDVIQTHFFQLAILFASESLYLELKKIGFDYKLLDKKIKFTLQKYFNRMCYRPTPFGVFSAFTSIYWSTKTYDAPCVLSDGDIFINPDFQLLVSLGRELETSDNFQNLKYYSNNTIYNIKNEKRYLTVRYDNQLSKSTFLIASFKPDRLLNKIITFCKNGKTKKELTVWLIDLIGTDEGICDYIDDLISEDLLVSEIRPNLSGKKYFDRLIDITSTATEDKKLSNLILQYKHLNDTATKVSAVSAEYLANNFSNEIQNPKIKSAFYIGYEKKSDSTLTIKYQEDIKDALLCLNKLVPSSQSKSISTFKTKFRAKFEDREIPLLQALDREAGIGYEGLEANLFNSELLDGIQLDLHSNSVNFNWTPVHEFFLAKLSGKSTSCITISNNDIEKIQIHSNLKLPPSFSVIFRIHNDKIWIEQAGGCTATSLLGRFTQFNTSVLDETLIISSREQELNKDIIFAEVSCFNDEHAANIITNAGIRDYEIPIGVYSTLNKSNIIHLSDIIISLVGDELILKSKRLNKVIIPRLSSAYNYSRSDLSIYRFLCDLQCQGLKFNYNFDLKTLLPGLNFYPRVEYKNCILFPATWILTSEEIFELSDKDNFIKLAQKLNLTQYFAVTEGDNQLVFDRYNTISIDIFINVIKNKSSAVLQEAFIDEKITIQDSSNKPLVGQFIASILNDSPTYYPPILTSVDRKIQTTKRIYLPGDEWLYFKLYCHPSIANNILTKHIRPIINGLKNKCILKSWYFIRYNDIDNHLRVRVQINKNNTAEVIQYFEKRFRSYVKKGSINNLLVDTYKREIERYGALTIVHAEKIFETSSDIIINYLKNAIASTNNYAELHLAIVSTNDIMGLFFDSNYDKIMLLKLIHENMKHEFEDSKQVKIQLDNKYREYSPFINNIDVYKPSIIKITGKKEYNTFLDSINNLKQKTLRLPKQQLYKLIADIMHMHLNRIFNEKQRMQEFIIYYLLHKYYSSLEARKGKISSMLATTSDGFSINNIEKGVFK